MVALEDEAGRLTRRIDGVRVTTLDNSAAMKATGVLRSCGSELGPTPCRARLSSVQHESFMRSLTAQLHGRGFATCYGRQSVSGVTGVVARSRATLADYDR